MFGIDGQTESNLALNRPASQSSAFMFNTTITVPLEASFAVDSVLTSTPVPGQYSCSSTEDLPDGQNWLMVDLGRLVSITFVVLKGTLNLAVYVVCVIESWLISCNLLYVVSRLIYNFCLYFDIYIRTSWVFFMTASFVTVFWRGSTRLFHSRSDQHIVHSEYTRARIVSVVWSVSVPSHNRTNGPILQSYHSTRQIRHNSTTTEKKLIFDDLRIRSLRYAVYLLVVGCRPDVATDAWSPVLILDSVLWGDRLCGGWIWCIF